MTKSRNKACEKLLCTEISIEETHLNTTVSLWKQNISINPPMVKRETFAQECKHNSLDDVPKSTVDWLDLVT